MLLELYSTLTQVFVNWWYISLSLDHRYILLLLSLSVGVWENVRILYIVPCILIRVAFNIWICCTGGVNLVWCVSQSRPLTRPFDIAFYNIYEIRDLIPGRMDSCVCASTPHIICVLSETHNMKFSENDCGPLAKWSRVWRRLLRTT